MTSTARTSWRQIPGAICSSGKRTKASACNGSSASSAIRLEKLGKRYGSVPALDGLSLEVRRGEIFGFLGLNGAGKTTTIRILLDLVHPTTGRAFVFGRDCRTDGLAARAHVGYLPGELGFYGEMTGAMTLDLLARLSARRVDPAWRDWLLERLMLEPADLRRPVRDYSTGMKRKLGIVQAFQAAAPLLILDEPTDGLDPLMQEVVYALLAEMQRRGTTVFMSSHVLPEVERVCDRIGLLRRGKLVLVSAVADVRRMAARTVCVRFGADVAPPPVWPDGVEAIAVTPQEWRLRIRGPLGGLMTAIRPLPVNDLDVHEPHLEDVLRQYYGEEQAQ